MEFWVTMDCSDKLGSALVVLVIALAEYNLLTYKLANHGTSTGGK